VPHQHLRSSAQYLVDAFDYCTAGGNYNDKEENYVTPRGSVLYSVDEESVSIKYAKSVRYGQYVLEKVTSAEGSANVVTCNNLKEGDECDVGGGYKVKVSAIDCTTSGSATGGSSGACELTGLDGVMASPSTAAVVSEINTATMPMVVLDSQAGAGNLIVVGGPAVNTQAKAMAAASAITPGSEPVVKVEGNKILVAGWSAADTQAAANALINWLNQNRDAVRSV